jgi:hypothetical protein
MTSLQTVIIYNEALITSATAYFHISGTHGCEGPAGAEIQISLLERHGIELAKSKVGFLLIFALNPFGFHYLRRTSRDNIDLNRNSGDGIPGVPPSKLHNWLKPLWRSQSFTNYFQGAAQGIVLSMAKGFYPIGGMFAEGQSIEPQGLFYTGVSKAVEIQALFSQLSALLKHKALVSIFDVHTGLGRLHEEMLILCLGNESKITQLYDKPVEIPGQKPQSYRGIGILADRFQSEFPHIEIQFIVQEFGVKSTAKSFLVLALENQYHWQDFSVVAEHLYLKHPVKDLLFSTFFSIDPTWLAWLRTQGTERFMQAFRS